MQNEDGSLRVVEDPGERESIKQSNSKKKQQEPAASSNNRRQAQVFGQEMDEKS